MWVHYEFIMNPGVYTIICILACRVVVTILIAGLNEGTYLSIRTQHWSVYYLKHSFSSMCSNTCRRRQLLIARVTLEGLLLVNFTSGTLSGSLMLFRSVTSTSQHNDVVLWTQFDLGHWLFTKCFQQRLRVIVSNINCYKTMVFCGISAIPV